MCFGRVLALTVVNAFREYLTSFSKRKQERRKKALKALEDRAKQERVAARKEYREQLVEQKRGEVTALLNSKKVKIEEDDEEKKAKEVVQALAGENERVDQIVDDFSAHAFGSALVTVTTSVPVEEEENNSPSGDLIDSIAKAHVPRLPKNSKFAITDTERQASRLRDKLLSKKKGPQGHQNRGSQKKKGGKRK